MTRLNRKNRSDIQYLSKGSIGDALDNVLKQVWRINDNEYDFLTSMQGFVIDSVMSVVTIKKPSYTELKKSIKIINFCLKCYYELSVKSNAELKENEIFANESLIMEIIENEFGKSN